MSIRIAAVSFDFDGAAAATGVSPDTIRRAVKAGDIEIHFPKIEGRQLKKPLIEADELRRWVLAGDTEREAS